MVAGHLREQNGYFQMILSWKGSDGKRKRKSISTGLPIKGNKKRAEAMLLKTRKEFNPDNLLENADVPFCDFLLKWLKDRATSMGSRVYANYAWTSCSKWLRVIPWNWQLSLEHSTAYAAVRLSV